MTESGGQAQAIWLKETAYADTTTGSAKSFGNDLKISNFTRKNNAQVLYGINNQQGQVIVPLQYEGSFTADFVLSDPWIFYYILGNDPSTTGSGPYVHKFLDTAATPVFASKVGSINVAIGQDRTTDNDINCKGAVMKSTTFDMTVNEPVKVTSEFEFATDNSDTTLASNVNPTDAPFNFAHASLEFPTSTTITDAIQNLNLTINRNTTILRGLGSRIGQAFYNGKAEYDLKMDIPQEGATWQELLYGTGSATTPAGNITEQAGLKIILDNGEATTANRKIELEFLGSIVDEIGMPLDVNELISESINFKVRAWKTCICTNNTATMP